MIEVFHFFYQMVLLAKLRVCWMILRVVGFVF